MLDLLSTADRMAIHEVYSGSVMLLELGRCDEWTDLFERGGRLQCPGAADGRGICGREALFSLGQRVIRGEVDLALGCLASAERYHHVLSNISLRYGGAGCASANALLTVMTRGGAAPPRLVATGIYSDRLRKSAASCWRFESRTLNLDGAPVLCDRMSA